MTTPKLRKAPLWAPVVDGRARLDLGIFDRRIDAAAIATMRAQATYGATHRPSLTAARVWVAVER